MCTDFMIRKCVEATRLGNVNAFDNSLKCTAVIITKATEHCSTSVCSRHKHYITNSVSKPHDGLEGRLCLSLTGVSRWLTSCRPLSHEVLCAPYLVSSRYLAVREPSTKHGSRYTGCLKATVPRNDTEDPTGTDTQPKESYKSKSGPQRISRWV
jgi:hypothetical protein